MLRHDCQLRRFSRVQSSFGGTTETQKEIIARGPVGGNRIMTASPASAHSPRRPDPGLRPWPKVLSAGGQRQRLSIARALVKHPRLYLFDDCFSALDAATDARLRAALRRHTRDATVVIVAQRVSTIMQADQIIMLEEGRIAGIGTHQQLLMTCPSYREIVTSQLGEGVAA
jgi:ABC-type uncharacterized transport system fused permease/ATPase subunit